MTPDKLFYREDHYMSHWLELEWKPAGLRVEAESQCILPLADPELVFPTLAAWGELKNALSGIKLGAIRSDRDVMDGFQASWEIRWGAIKSKRTVINPRGEAFEGLRAAISTFTVSDDYPRGVIYPCDDEIE